MKLGNAFFILLSTTFIDIGVGINDGNNSSIGNNTSCITLLKDETIHIVVAGYSSRCDLNFLGLLGLSHVEIYQYMRNIPRNLSSVRRPDNCNMTIHKIVLQSKVGRDASVFYDYLVRIYESPPSYMIFLHGHVGNAWHTSCYTIYSRIREFFQLVSTSKQSSITNRMITLTSHRSGGFKILNWHRNFKQAYIQHYNMQSKNYKSNYYPSKSLIEIDKQNISAICNSIFKNYSIPKKHFHTESIFSCGSFILPQANIRIRSNPIELYKDLHKITSNPSYSEYDSIRHCFENVVYRMFRESTMNLTSELESWYEYIQFYTYEDEFDMKCTLAADNCF
eukprot:gene7502-15353_t